MKRRKTPLSRRLSEYGAKALGAPAEQISDEDLDRIITNVGYELDAEKRKLLRNGLSDALTWAGVFDTALRQTPAPWEIKERLKAIQSSATTIWSNLGIGKPPGAAWTEKGILSTDINAALWPPLRQAAETWGQQHEPKDFSASEIPKHSPLYALGPYNPYADNRMRDVVYAIAALIFWSHIALATISDAHSQNRPKRSPDYAKLGLTRTLALIFRTVYGRDPTQTRGGPWLTFLRESLVIGGFGKIDDEAARKLWHRSKSMGPM
jgi:hypothetical protein